MIQKNAEKEKLLREAGERIDARAKAREVDAKNQAAVAELFVAENPLLMTKWEEIAAFLVVEGKEVGDLEAEAKRRKDNLNELKKQLAEEMFANGSANGHKMDNGIYPKPYIQTKIFKASEVGDDTMLQWFRDNDLGSIIRETIPWQTMNATLKKEIEQGKEIPDSVFQITRTPTVKFVGRGHILFLEGKMKHWDPVNEKA